MNKDRIYSILYIEDNEVNRELVHFILQQRDYLSLTCSKNGESGIKKAKEQLPDLILLDISLPDIDGYTVFSTLRNDPATCNIPIVALSGHPRESQKATEPGFDSYLTKPIQVEPLYNTIDTLLKL